jgi:site-specific recombinase XerC
MAERACGGSKVSCFERRGVERWCWKTKSPLTGAWETVHFSPAMAHRFGVSPSGKGGIFVRDDVLRTRWEYERKLADEFRAAVSAAAKTAEAGRGAEVDVGSAGSRIHVDRNAGGAFGPHSSSATTVTELFDRFLAAKGRKNQEATLRVKRRVFAKFRESVGRAPVSQIDDRHVVAFMNAVEMDGWRGRPLTATTLRDYLGYLRSAFSWAHTQGLVARNPFVAIDLPGRSAPTTPYWTPDEIAARLSEHFGDQESESVRFHLAAVFFLGLSPKEWAGADWSHVDVPRERLFVDKVKQKSGKMRRGWVPIPHVLAPAFERRLRDAGPIWPRPDSGHHTRESIEVYRRQVERRWPSFNFLGLRKSTAAFLGRKIPDAILRDRINRHQSSTGKALECQSTHYEPYDFQMLKDAVDRAFSDLTSLAALITPPAVVGPNLSLPSPAERSIGGSATG